MHLIYVFLCTYICVCIHLFVYICIYMCFIYNIYIYIIKIQLGILSTSFWSWTEGIFSHVSKIAFFSSEIAEYCRPPSLTFATINPHKFSIGLKSGEHAGWSRSLIFCSNNYFFVIDALWIAALSCWKVHSSPHRRHPSCASDKSFSIFT